jgi:predicted ATPase
MGDYATVGAQAELLDGLASEHGFALYQASAAVWRSWLDAKEGRTAEAIALLEKGVSAYQATGAVWTVPFMLLELADVHRFAGDPKKSLEALDKALEWIEQTRWWWLKPEVLRRRGEILLTESDQQQAEQVLEQSLALARKQGAKWWELRSAASLARLWQRQHREKAAFNILKTICESFTEGHQSNDIVAARELLVELTQCLSDRAPKRAPHLSRGGFR